MRELTDGSTAIVRAALQAGCDFFAGYPITPASPILMMMLREMPSRGGVAIQAEDEIASLGMCIGAAMTGRRAMTASSGPGLSLFSEQIGLAVMGEVPVVIVDVQRMGPATGGATTVGQGDVQFLRWGTSGGYPVIVLAPSSVLECHSLTLRAFALAERFRCPVFLLTDKELNLTAATVEADAFEKPPPPKRRVACTPDSVYSFQPADGVPPMTHFGEHPAVRFTGSTHDERAFICKDPTTVERLNTHLAAKIEGHRDEIEMAASDLQPGARTLLVSYGITAGAMREAVRMVREAGRQVSSLTPLSLWPVPQKAIRKALAGIQRVVVAELNHGQYRREVERVVAGTAEVLGMNRVDGQMVSPNQFVEAAQ